MEKELDQQKQNLKNSGGIKIMQRNTPLQFNFPNLPRLDENLSFKQLNNEKGVTENKNNQLSSKILFQDLKPLQNNFLLNQNVSQKIKDENTVQNNIKEEKIQNQNSENEPQVVKILNNIFPPPFIQAHPSIIELIQQNEINKEKQKQTEVIKQQNPQNSQKDYIIKQIEFQSKSLIEKYEKSDQLSEKSQSSDNSQNQVYPRFLKQSDQKKYQNQLKLNQKDTSIKENNKNLDEKNIEFQKKHSNQKQNENNQPNLIENELEEVKIEQKYQNYKNDILSKLKNQVENVNIGSGLITLPEPSLINKQRGIIGIDLGFKKDVFNIQQIDLQQKINSINNQNYNGEIIGDTYQTYNSIENLAPIIYQDENLSLNIRSRNVKIFYNKNYLAQAKNIICFIQNEFLQKNEQLSINKYVETNNNISIVINQQDFIQNILSNFHQKGKLLGNILDFTVRKFRYLYILYAKSIVVLDLKDLLNHNKQQNEIKLIYSIQLQNLQKNQQKQENSNNEIQENEIKNDQASCQQNLYSCIEVTGDQEQSILLFSQIQSKLRYLQQDQKQENLDILHIDCSNFIDSEECNQNNNQQYYLDHQNSSHSSFFNITKLQLFNSKQTKNQISCQILDICTWDSYLAVLFEKNNIIIFDFKILTNSNNNLSQKIIKNNENEKLSKNQKDKISQILQFQKPIFKSTFADAIDQISQIFFIKDFTKNKNDYYEKEDLSDIEKQNDQDSSDNSDMMQEYTNKKLQGHFLLVETKLQKSQQDKSKIQALKKLHIVEIQDSIGPLYIYEEKSNQKQSSPKRGQNTNKNQQQLQSLNQIGQLTFTDSCQKYVSYEHQRGIVFLMNQERQDRQLKLFSIKLKKEMYDDSDSDDTSNKNQFSYKFRFQYITEVRLWISNSSFSSIQNINDPSSNKNSSQQQLLRSPQYLNVLYINNNIDNNIKDDVNISEQEDYFIYTNIMDQVLAFKRQLSHMIPSNQEMVKVISLKHKNINEVFNDNKHQHKNVNQINSAINQQIKVKQENSQISEQSDMNNKYQQEEISETSSQKAIHEDINQYLRDNILEEEISNNQRINESNQDAFQQLQENQNQQEYIYSNQLLNQKDKNQIQSLQDNNSDEDKNDQLNQNVKAEDQNQQDKLQQKNQLSKKERKQQKKADKKQQIKNSNINENEDDQESLQKQKAKVTKMTQQQPQILNNQSIQSLQQSSLLGIQTQQSNQQKKQQKVQELNIIENFGELTKKYQELAQKTNQLQQQLQRQQQQKTEVEQAIKKAVQEAVGEKIIGEQLRDTVVPILTKRVWQVSDYVNQDILPKIEKKIEDLFKQLISNDDFNKQQEASITPENINMIIQKEFRQALQNQILPDLEKSVKQVLESLEKKLNQIDVALCEKLSDEDERWQQMINNYNNSLDWLKVFHKKMLQMVLDLIKQKIQDEANNQKILIQSQMKREMNIILQEQMKHEIQSQIQKQVQIQVHQQLQSLQLQPLLQQQLLNQQQQYQNLQPTNTLGLQNLGQFSSFDGGLKFNNSVQYPIQNSQQNLYENPNQIQSFLSQEQYSFTNKDQDILKRENLRLNQENEYQKQEISQIKKMLNILSQKSEQKNKNSQKSYQNEDRNVHPLDKFITQRQKINNDQKNDDKFEFLNEELEAKREFKEDVDIDDAEYGNEKIDHNIFDNNYQNFFSSNISPYQQTNQKDQNLQFKQNKYYQKSEQFQQVSLIQDLRSIFTLFFLNLINNLFF